VALFCSLSSSRVRADDKVKIDSFAEKDGTLTRYDLIQYIIFRTDYPPAKLAAASKQTMVKGEDGKMMMKMTVDLDKVAQDSQFVFALEAAGDEPYTKERINAVPFIQEGKTDEQKDKDLPGARKIPYVTAPYITRTEEYNTTPPQKKTFSGREYEVKRDMDAYLKSLPPDTVPIDRSASSLGPFRLRKDVKSFAQDMWALEVSKDPKDMASIQGASISYSNDFLIKGNGAWSTEGALLWPVTFLEWPDKAQSWAFHMAPAVYWKIQEQEKTAPSDINELRFSVPLSAGWRPGTDTWRNEYFFNAEPYYQTDTNFRGEILGATASFEYRNKYLGHYWKIFGLGDRDLYGRLRVTGIADYSSVENGSKYISRPEGSNWFRLGGEVAFDLGAFSSADTSLATIQPITATVSYRFTDAVSGEGGYADLLKANLTYWFNPYIGLTADYQRGQTPVADKDIDLLTIGLQIKF
jgi:hypothetical protein